MSDGNILERKMLGFQKTVRKYFSFLENQYDFKCIFSDLYCVKFYSKKVYLNVYHERISYEIYFEIGLLPEEYNNTLKADVRDVLDNSSNTFSNSYFQASKKDDIDIAVEKLANLVKQNGKDLLIGSTSDFKSISNKRTERQQKALFFGELRISLEKANNAWNCKDYKTVTEAYEQYEEYLNPIQLKRLEYTRKIISRN